MIGIGTLLANAGISLFSSLIEEKGEQLISKGIEKVTGISLENKKELTPEEKQIIIDNQLKILELDFEKLKEENRAKEFDTIESNKNTANARDNNTKIQESSNSSKLAKNTPYILDFIAIASVFILGFCLFFVEIPEGNIQILNIMFGALLSMAQTVYNYHRGSSAGSASKSETIDKLNVKNK